MRRRAPTRKCPVSRIQITAVISIIATRGFPEALPKGREHRVVRAADDEVHDLDGREDDP